jgi:two-component system chemotaxis sensor kinase CheA
LAEYASGLEKKVVERTAELAHINDGMRLVLDNVEQGFITIDLQGVMSLERSTVCARWFGAPAPGQSLVEALRRYDSLAAEWLHVGLDEIREGILPLKLLIHQLPAHIRLGERAMRLAYQPIYGANLSSSAKEGTRPSGGPEHLLVVITDITEELARERVERDSREMIHMFQRIALDRDGFTQFMEEVSAMIEKLKDGSDSIATERRLVHTIKGNTSLYGIESMAKVCHELETKLAEEERAIKADEHKQLAQAWDHVQAMVAPFLGNHRAAVELEEDDYQSLLQAIRAGATTDKLLAIVVAWRRELVSVRFQRLADKAQYLAKRLGKPAPTIHQQARGIRLDAHRWNAFWSALAHAINNALDHGIEGVDARRAANKPGAGQVWLDAEMKSGELVISVRDDGGGIDWAKVAIKAAARGLPHQTQPDLIEALFTDGVSTRNEASLTSGRGTGMGALRQAVRDLGGSTNVTSTPGQGTTLSFRFSPEAQVGIDHAA